MSDLAKIVIQIPVGCTRRSLSMNALDERGRQLARQTFIFVDGKQLLCTAFRVEVPKGSSEKVLQLTVATDCFEIYESADPAVPPTRTERKSLSTEAFEHVGSQ